MATSFLNPSMGGSGDPYTPSAPPPASAAAPTSPSSSAWSSGSAVGAAGAGLEAFGQIAQGILAQKRARRVANYNADVAEANAQAQAQAAMVEALQYERSAALTRQDALLLGQAQTWRDARASEQHAAVLGQTRAIIGASGIQMEGSPLTVYEETIRQFGLDTLAQHYQTRLQGRALEEQAGQAEYQATLARYGAGERLRVGNAQAGLIRGNVDETQVTAGLLRASGTALKGYETYRYQEERLKAAKNPSLVSR